MVRFELKEMSLPDSRAGILSTVPYSSNKCLLLNVRMHLLESCSQFGPFIVACQEVVRVRPQGCFSETIASYADCHVLFGCLLSCRKETLKFRIVHAGVC